MGVTIRQATSKDAAQILEIYSPFCGDSGVSFEIRPPTIEEMESRIDSTTKRYPWLVCERDGLILGYAYAGPYRQRAAYRWAVEVTVYVHDGSQRKGVGRALYTVLFRILRLQGFHKAYAGTTLPNPASVGLHKAMGFEPVGVYRGVGYKAGKWHDVAWWQLSLQAEATPPKEPRDVTEIQATEGWKEAIAEGEELLRLGALNPLNG
jgi:L-amino acid N-acyltransferase YncA